MKRAIVVAISVILALVVAAPIASGKSGAPERNQPGNADRRFLELDHGNKA